MQQGVDGLEWMKNARIERYSDGAQKPEGMRVPRLEPLSHAYNSFGLPRHALARREVTCGALTG